MAYKHEENGVFLSDILMSLHCAVVVTGLDGEVFLTNPEAIRLNVVADGLIEKWITQMGDNDADDEVDKIEWDEKDGRKLSVTRSTLKTEGESKGGYIFIIDDVTEITRLRKQNTRAEKLSAIGEMAAGMAHEIRNPLGGIEIFTSLLMRDLKDDSEKTRMLSHITTGVQSINNVVSNFLLFTKEPQPVKNQFDLKKLILDTLEFAGYVFEQKSITVKAFLPEDAIPFLGDAGLIRQALLNMIHNATQAMPDGGDFSISVIIVEDARVEIICKDTGPGAPDEVKDKIFDPFFTTKEQGIGLGLAIVSQIVQAHGGYVDLLDSGGDGAAFIISLPYGD